jgi:hypothetical protein
MRKKGRKKERKKERKKLHTHTVQEGIVQLPVGGCCNFVSS